MKAPAVAREGDVVKMDFRQPNVFDRTVNRAFGFFLKLGLGLQHNYLLEVRGRKTGRVHSTPVNLIEFKHRKYLVAPRGYTQWVRNAEASGEATLIRGASRERVKLQVMPDEMKAEILKAYLDRFKLTVQRYFPIPAGSPPETFRPLSANYPVFEVSDGAKP
jgi:deazaflavin-dependent oxidoreductase (nitroreductase family)